MNLALAIVLSGMFVISGIGKIIDPLSFQKGMLSLDMFPVWLTALISHSLPAFELSIAVTLLLPLSRKIAAFHAAILLTCFSIFLGWIVFSGIDYSCKCFGSILSYSPSTGIIIDLIFAAAAVALCVLTPPQSTGEATSTQSTASAHR